MATLHSASHPLLDWLLRTSWQAALIAILILAATWLLRRFLPPSARYALLLLVAARLLMPATPQSRTSIFNLFDRSQPQITSAPITTPQSTGDWIISKKSLFTGTDLATIPADAAPIATSPPTFPWRTLLVALWLAGILFLAIRVIRANFQLSRRLRSANPITDPHILDLVCSCKARMKVTGPIAILETDAIQSPALMGLFRPRLLLPLGLRDTLSTRQLRFVFLHELAHLKRNDIALDWVLAILQMLHWFNPMIWIAFARLRAERELARDAMVLAATQPADQQDYGATILKLVESFGRLGPRPGTIGILEANNGKTHLIRRITMIADHKKRSPLGFVLAALLALALLAATFTDKAAVATQAADPAPKEKIVGAGEAPADPNAAQPQPIPRGNLPARGDRDDAAQRDAAAEALLNRRLPEVNFQQVALADAVDFLRDVSGANIQVNWKVLEAAGIERTAPTTARLRDVRFSKVLTTILDDVGGGGGVQLGYEIDDGVLVISTAEDLNRNVLVRVYDIRDLLTAAKDEKRAEELAGDVVQVIVETVDPSSWVQNGGRSTVRYLSGQLIVTQPKGAHRQLATLLDQIRERHALQVSLQVQVIELPRALLDDPRVNVDWNDKASAAVDSKRASDLIKIFAADNRATTLAAPRLMLSSGQEGTIRLGQEIPYISGLTNPKDGKRENQLSMLFAGFSLSVQPTVSADRKSVTMNIHPRITELLKMMAVPADAGGDEKLTIQKPDLAVREVEQTVSIADGATLLTLLKDDGRGKNAKGTVTLIMIRPDIIQPREILDPKPQ